MTYPVNPLSATFSPYVGYIGGPTGTAFTITNAARTAGGVATLTIGTHTRAVGERVVVSGLSGGFVSLNGSYTITGVTGTTVRYDSEEELIASGSASGTALIGPRQIVNEVDNLYLSNDGPAYRHYKDNARTEFWDELLFSSDNANLVDPDAPLGGIGAQYPS